MIDFMSKNPGTDPGYFAVTGWEGSFSCCVPYSRSFNLKIYYLFIGSANKKIIKIKSIK
jgi:hypothetical protein